MRAVPFDTASLTVTGNPVPLVEDVAVKQSGAADFAVSDNGHLVYRGGDGGSQGRSLVWVDRQGREEAVALEPAAYTWVRVSPDGTRLTWVEGGDVWVSDLSRPGSRIRVTTDNGSPQANPVWTPDGTHVVFQSGGIGAEGQPSLFSKSADGTGDAEQLLALDDAIYVYGYQFTPDGQTLLAATRTAETGDDFGALSLDDGTWQPLLDTPAPEGNPAISPDGNWVAYRSHETGESEVYVAQYPTMQARQSVSTGGGFAPVWSVDGTELFYQNGSQMMVVPVTTGPTLTLGAPEILFDGPYRAFVGRNYDLAPDGRFLMIALEEAGNEDAPPPQITVVLNWHQELLERVPVRASR